MPQKKVSATIQVTAVVDGKDGTSPWIADLSNEMDSVACDLNGKPMAAKSLTTTIALFYGQTAKTFGTPTVKRNGTALTVNASSYASGVRVTYSNKVLTVAYNTSAVISGTDEYEITITASDDSSVVRTLTFSVLGARPGATGEAATTYQLVPSASEIVRRKDGSYSPASLTCYCTSLKDGTATDNPSGADKQYSYDGAIWASFTSRTSFAASTIYAQTGKKLYLRLLVDGKVMDKETVPVVEEGVDGQDAVTLLATTVLFNVPCDEEGCAERDMTLTSYVQMLYGETPMPISVSLDDDKSDFEATISAVTGSTTVKKISVSVTKDALITADSRMVFDVTGTHEGISYTRTLNIPIIGNRKGATGEQGHVGKMFYMSGDYPDGGALFASSEWVTPVVHIKNGTTDEWYWLDAESNVIPGTDPQEYYAPASNSPVWKKAFSEYKVVLTEALFADFASLASGLISGDYFFSKHGTINGIDYDNNASIDGVPAYMFFNDGQIRTFAASGNVKTEAEHTVVARVYLCAGCTVEISATGKVLRDTGTGFTTLAVFKQGADKHVGSTVSFSGTAGVQRTLTFTATETAAYEIGFYFPTYYEDKICILEDGAIRITGQGFLPNWFVDLKTGRMSAAKGNFVVDGDLVRMKNAEMQDVVMRNAVIRESMMYHRVALFKTGSYPNDADHLAYDYQVTTKKEYSIDGEQKQYVLLTKAPLLGDTFLVVFGVQTTSANVIHLPPARLCMGARIKIIYAFNSYSNYELGIDVVVDEADGGIGYGSGVPSPIEDIGQTPLNAFYNPHGVGLQTIVGMGYLRNSNDTYAKDRYTGVFGADAFVGTVELTAGYGDLYKAPTVDVEDEDEISSPYNWNMVWYVTEYNVTARPQNAT